PTLPGGRPALARRRTGRTARRLPGAVLRVPLAGAPPGDHRGGPARTGRLRHRQPGHRHRHRPLLRGLRRLGGHVPRRRHPPPPVRDDAGGPRPGRGVAAGAGGGVLVRFGPDVRGVPRDRRLTARAGRAPSRRTTTAAGAPRNRTRPRTHQPLSAGRPRLRGRRPQQIPHQLEIDVPGLTEPQTPLAHVVARQTLLERLPDITAHEIEGAVLLLTRERDLRGTAAPHIGRHPVRHDLVEPREFGPAQLAQPRQDASAVFGDLGEVAVDVCRVALHHGGSLCGRGYRVSIPTSRGSFRRRQNAGVPSVVPSSPGVSARMSRQASKDTGAELAVRRLLHAAGLRYRVEYPVPGMARRRIDVAFTRAKVAVLIDGCFWHGCPEHATHPKSNADWWRTKLDRNMAR